MDILLKVLGSCFLAIIILMVVGVLMARLGIRRFARRFIEAADAAGPPPGIIHLLPSSPRWKDQAKVDEATGALTLHGFVKIGEFSASEMPGIHLRAFTKESENVYAVVYEHVQGIVWCDLWQGYEDGRALTVTSAPKGGELDSPTYATKVFMPYATAEELYQSFKESKLDGDPTSASAEEFTRKFEEEFKRSMEWRAARGGPTDDEIRRVAALDGVELSEDRLEQMRQHGHAEAMWQLDTLLRQRFLDSGAVTAAQWDTLQHNVYIIHAQMHDRDLTDVLERASGALVDAEDPKWALPNLPVLEKFELLLGRLEGHSPLRPIWETTDPLEARVYEMDPSYVAPEWDEDDE